jgi:DNA-binding MarR family transcriptional regulator
MHRFMINIKSAHIFNRYFEMQKSTRNGKKNAEIGANRTSHAPVYLRGIYLDIALGEIHTSLNHPARRHLHRLARRRKMLQVHPLLSIHSRMSAGSQTQLSVLLALSHLLEQVEGDLGLPLSRTLVAVSLEPGLSVNELAERLGVPQQTASRYVAILQGRYEAPSIPLSVSARTPLLALEISQLDPRRRALFVTPEGEKRIERLIASYSRDHDQTSCVSQPRGARASDRLDCNKGS